MSRASLQMYAFPGLEAANQALWDRVRDGVPGTPETLADTRSIPESVATDVVFTQVCGFPLFRRLHGQAVMLGIPRYGFEGCDGITHRAAFIVRADEPVETLTAMRGRVFGCNSYHSNTGMNLPRLSLARLGGGKKFFERIVGTDSHMTSLGCLQSGTVDLCCVDCVTWGLAQRYRPERTAGLRVLDWTEPSPCLPFVTSVATPHATAALLVANLLGQTEAGLGLVGVEAAEPAAYAILADYEREAVERGYPVLA